MIRINHAVLHVFDFTSCVNVFSETELDVTNRQVKSYITKHVNKALSSVDNKTGEFEADSMFAEELRAYARQERDFIGLSTQIAQFIAGELGRMSKSESIDLLVVDFEEEIKAVVGDADAIDAAFEGKKRHFFAVLLLESKQAFMHDIGYSEDGRSLNSIERHHAILPSPSQKVASYAVIDMKSLNVAFQDKKREIAGQETWLIPDGLLKCSMQASSREVIGEITRIVEEVAEEYGANSAVALSRAKAYVSEAAEEGRGIAADELADEVFEDEAIRESFVRSAAEENFPERVNVDKTAAEKVVRNHKIRTDTGIEITFPAEYVHNPEFIEFASTPNGLISIELKNIGRIENR